MAQPAKKMPTQEQAVSGEFSLRQIAANFISTNESIGLNRLDDFTIALYNKKRKRYNAIINQSIFLFCIFFVLLLFGLALNHSTPKIAGAFCLLGCLFFLVGLWRLMGWRSLQYGFTFPLEPRDADYSECSKEAAQELEKLFRFLQSGVAPRAYYYKRNGFKSYLDHKCFYGSLRPLLLSPERSVRELVFYPYGAWLSKEIFIHSDMRAIIQKANAKPSKPQEQTEGTIYDYKSLLLLIIEHPSLRAINPDDHSSRKKIIDLIEQLSDAEHNGDDADFEKRTPKRTQMYLFASEILAAIKKNRNLDN